MCFLNYDKKDTEKQIAKLQVRLAKINERIAKREAKKNGTEFSEAQKKTALLPVPVEQPVVPVDSSVEYIEPKNSFKHTPATPEIDSENISVSNSTPTNLNNGRTEPISVKVKKPVAKKKKPLTAEEKFPILTVIAKVDESNMKSAMKEARKKVGRPAGSKNKPDAKKPGRKPATKSTTAKKATVKTPTKKVATKSTTSKKITTKPVEVKYTVTYDETSKKWIIKKTGAARIIDSKLTKDAAVKRVKELSKKQAANFSIQKMDGKFQKHN